MFKNILILCLLIVFNNSLYSTEERNELNNPQRISLASYVALARNP